jgi:type I restriction enzyme, S subunit
VLLKQLESERLRRYFGQRAGGSTRYGLSTRAISQAPILVPPEEIQRRIGEIHRSLDTQITHTEALIAKQEQVRAGLMQNLFARGVDETGRLRPPREEAPELYHETALGWLPRGWACRLFRSLLTEGPKNGHSPKEADEWTGTQKLGLGCPDEARIRASTQKECRGFSIRPIAIWPPGR